MSNASLVRIIFIVLVFGLLVYGFWSTRATTELVSAKVNEITPANEKKTVNPRILEEKIVTDIETYRIFGDRPVRAADGTLSRPNPFDGI